MLIDFSLKALRRRGRSRDRDHRGVACLTRAAVATAAVGPDAGDGGGAESHLLVGSPSALGRNSSTISRDHKQIRNMGFMESGAVATCCYGFRSSQHCDEHGTWLSTREMYVCVYIYIYICMQCNREALTPYDCCVLLSVPTL